MTVNTQDYAFDGFIAPGSGLVVAMIMCFTGIQLGPFAPLIIAGGIYFALFCLLIIFCKLAALGARKWRASKGR